MSPERGLGFNPFQHALENLRSERKHHLIHAGSLESEKPSRETNLRYLTFTVRKGGKIIDSKCAKCLVEDMWIVPQEVGHFFSLASYRMNDLRTPWKINMEHNSLEVLVQIIFLSFSWVMAVGEPAVKSSGVYFV